MEDYQYKMINLFNNNFKCTDVWKILNLYKKDIFLLQYFENVNLKEEQYKHPLFKNYNYCLFCGEKRKTKYNSTNLINSHMELEEKNIGHYLLNNNIKLRDIRNKKEKISKRRFINSYDNISNNNSLKNQPHGESDTELYIFNSNVNDSKAKKVKYKNKIKERRFKKLITLDLNRKLKKSISKELREKFNRNKRIINYDYTSRDKNNLISNNSSERKIRLEESKNFENIKLNLDHNDIKLNFNKDDKSFDKKDTIIDINEKDYYKKAKTISKGSNLIESSNLHASNNNSKIKLDKDKSKKNNKNIELKEEEDKISNKSNKLLNIFEQTKNFLGFGKKLSYNKLHNQKTFSNQHFLESQTHNVMLKYNTLKEGKLKNKLMKNYAEKNDNCSICLQEIKEKFTLICGDFFCRDCIRDTILIGIKEISNIDKLNCPTCKERIEENTIKKLLTQEEFQKYKYLITKIEGIKNKELIPCPYPDCPGYAEENQSKNNNIVFCNYEHIFCKKCLKIVEKNKGHICNENISEEEAQTMQFFKKNNCFRKCPNCQSMVVREGGSCNNMTCTNIWCGYEFCWICNRKYDESHYRNPLSMCFGLAEMNSEAKLAKYTRMRFYRCILIFMLIIFVILPVIVVFFSIFEACLYIVTFVLDGSAMKNIKLKSLFAHKLFYKIVYGFFIAIGFAFIPIGYISLVLLIISGPIFFIFNKIREKNDDELE